MDEQIKEAFSRVKQDIFSFGDELNKLKLLLAEMRNELKILTQALNDIREKEFLAEKPRIQTPTHIPTQEQKVPTIQQINQTHSEIPTDKLLSQVLKRQNTPVSIGNEGVPTNKQTNKQTNQQIIQHIKIAEKPYINLQLPTTIEPKEINLPTTKESRIDQLARIDEILSSLDALKKELRMKIKRLTNQEMAVFSLLYSLENEGNEVDYPLLSSRLSLSEASIRDYIGKIQKKGIPIIKEKLNNKKIILHLSQDFKKIASLDTIIKLREL